jgi:hypothetical protein
MSGELLRQPRFAADQPAGMFFGQIHSAANFTCATLLSLNCSAMVAPDGAALSRSFFIKFPS